MKISIPLTQDTENSYPSDSIEFITLQEEVSISFTDSAREVRVNLSDLRKLLLAITD